MRRRSIFMMAEGAEGAGGNGGGGEPDRSWLPEDLRSAPALAGFKDPAALAKSYVETKALVGSSLRPPGPDASPEARKEFVAKLREKVPELLLVPEDEKARAEVEDAIWAKLGKPKEAKEYAAPKDLELTDEHLEALRAEAAAEGLTRRQFEARARRVAEAVKAAAKEQHETAAALKRELGAAFDERTGAAAAAAERLGFPKAVVEALKAGQVDVDTYKAFAQVSKAFGESRELATQDGGAKGRLTPSEAAAQLAEIRANPAYFNPRHPQNASLMAKAEELTALAYPDLAKERDRERA